MSGKNLFLIAALLASVALAQPFVNAPMLPLHNFVNGNNTEATVGAVIAWGYAFTANSNGVYAMNTTAPSNATVEFWDVLPGVTQMFTVGNWTNMSSMGVIAIAGPCVALYKMNMTNVWRAATLWTKNATFDLRSDSSSYGPSSQYPAMLANPMGGWMMVLGTQNTSNVAAGVSLPSTVYAVNPVDLSIIWQTVVNSDTTNFSPSFCSEFVWVLTQNRTTTSSSIEVRKMYIGNGTMTSWKVDTGYTSLTYLNVQYSQFMVLNRNGYYNLYWLNGTQIIYESVQSCGTMPFRPTLINHTWYAICGTNIFMYDNTTFAYSKFSTNSNIRCGAIHEYNHDFILSGRDVVYVGNSSGIFELVHFAAPATYSSYSYCTGAQFSYWFDGMKQPHMIDDLLHLSFTGSGTGSTGSVVVMNYRTKEVLVQIAGDVSPFGSAIVDFFDRRVFVASTEGYILQGYDFEPIRNSTSFAVDMSSTSSMRFSLAYNATNMSTYYISTDALYTIDSKGNSMQIATLNMYTASVQSIIVGQYLVIFDSYHDDVYVYNSVAKTIASKSICDLDDDVAPIVSNTMVIMFCSSSSTSANIVDVSATTLVVKTISASNYRNANGAVVIGTKLIITTGYSTVQGFDMTGAMTTAAWSTKSGVLSQVLSPIVEYMNNGYFVAYSYKTSSKGTYFANYVYKVSPSGSLTVVGQLMTNTDTDFKRLIIKSGGVFGGAIMYVIGNTNITAYTTTFGMMFNYKSTDSIQTRYQNNPVVLDSGAVCFYSSNGWFNVVGGFKGALAWRYPSSTSLYYPVLTDNTSIFFTDGQSVIGADVYTGAVNSISTYADGNTRGFAIAAGVNTTTVVGVTDDEIIFANQASRYPSTMAYFPGSGSAPGGNSFGEEEKSKAWIAGVVVGVIVVIAVVVFIMKRGGGGGKTDDNYVPMNPATQV